MKADCTHEKTVRRVVQRVYCFKIWSFNSLPPDQNEHLQNCVEHVIHIEPPHMCTAVLVDVCRVRKNDRQVYMYSSGGGISRTLSEAYLALSAFLSSKTLSASSAALTPLRAMAPNVGPLSRSASLSGPDVDLEVTYPCG